MITRRTNGDSGGVVGRVDEIAVVVAQIDRARDRRFGVAVVEGDAGIGKSSVADAAVGQRPDVRVLSSRSEGGTQPHAVVGDPLDLDLDHLVAGTADAGSRLYVLEHTVARRLEELAGGGATPTVVVLEDLHNATSETLALLAAITRNPVDGVALLATLRPAPGTPGIVAFLDSVAARGGARVRLGPLHAIDVAEIVRRRLGRDPGPLLSKALEAAGGNPLYVEEMLAALRHEGSLGEPTLAQAGTAALPADIHGAVLRHLAGIDGLDVALLRTASLLGRRFAPRDLAAVVGRPVAGLLRPLRTALAAEVLRPNGHLLEFSHDIVRDALYDSLPEDDRQRRHLDCATALHAAGNAPPAIASHLARTSVPPTLAGFAADTATSLQETNAALAAALFQAAIGAAPDCDARPAWEAALGHALVLAGRPADAEGILRSALHRTQDRALGRQLRFELFLALQQQGDQLAVRRGLGEMLATPDLLLEERVFLEAHLAGALLLSRDPKGADETSARAAAAVVHAGTSDGAATALAVRSAVAYATGQIPEAVELADRAAAMQRDLGVRPGSAGIFRGLALLDADRLDEASSVLRVGLRRDIEAGDLTNSTPYYWGLVALGYASGNWELGAESAEAALSLIADGLAPDTGSSIGHAFAVLTAHHRGEIADALELAAAAEQATSAPSLGTDFLMWAKARLFAEVGNVAAALQLLELAWALTAVVGYATSWRSIGPDLTRFAVAEGRSDLVRSVPELAADLAARAGEPPSAKGAALLCRALGDGDAGVASEAVNVMRVGPRIIDTARAAIDAATLASMAGDGPTAVEHARFARDAFAAAGGAHEVAKMDAVLLANGVRPEQREPPEAGWASLTPSELRVVDLVAEGLTNRQVADRVFLSVNTVNTHLRRAFAKLGVTTRVALAAEAARRS